MPRYKDNLEIYVEVADLLGLKTEWVRSSPRKKLLLISNDTQFTLVGTGSPGFYPQAKRWNASFTTSKVLSQIILKRLGYQTIKTQVIKTAEFSSWQNLKRHLESTKFQFPALVKPDRGQDGQDIAIVEDLKQLTSTTKNHFLGGVDFLIQPILNEREYRILVVNNKVEFIHSKENQKVVGDGVSTIEQLLSKVGASRKNNVFIEWQHKKLGTSNKTVLPKDAYFEHHLAKMATDTYYKTKDFPKNIQAWALKLAKDISSPVVGIDVFIPDSFDNVDEFIVIEINTNPSVCYLATYCKDPVTPRTIMADILKDYFKIK